MSGYYMKNWIFLLIIFSIFSTGAFAQQAFGNEGEFNYLEQARTLFNENRSALFFVGENDRIAFEITDGETKYPISIIVEDNKILDVKEGTMEDPTLKLYADADALKRLQESDQPAVDALGAVSSGEIRWERVTDNSGAADPITAIINGIIDFFKSLFGL